MTREEYICSVISQIEDKHIRKETEQELSAHLDDRIAYYAEAGYDEKYAVAKTLERMGDAKQVGYEMAQVHSGTSIKFSVIGSLVLFFAGGFLAFWGYLFSTTEMRSVTVVLDYLYFIVSTAFALRALRRRSIPLSFLSLLIFLEFLVLKFYSHYSINEYGGIEIETVAVSGILFSLYFLLTGRIKLFSIITTELENLTVKPWMFTASYIFYALVLAMIMAVVLFLLFTKNKRLTLRQTKQKARMERTAKNLLFALTLFCLVSLAVARIPFGYDFMGTTDRIIVVESDTQDEALLDSAKAYKADYYDDEIPDGVTIYDNNYDLFTNYADIYFHPWDKYADIADDSSWLEGDEELVWLDSNVAYYKNENHIYHAATEKYIYIMAQTVSDDIIFESGWLKTDGEHSFVFPVETGKYPLNVNTITVMKNGDRHIREDADSYIELQ